MNFGCSAWRCSCLKPAAECWDFLGTKVPSKTQGIFTNITTRSAGAGSAGLPASSTSLSLQNHPFPPFAPRTTWGGRGLRPRVHCLLLCSSLCASWCSAPHVHNRAHQPWPFLGVFKLRCNGETPVRMSGPFYLVPKELVCNAGGLVLFCFVPCCIKSGQRRLELSLLGARHITWRPQPLREPRSASTSVRLFWVTIRLKSPSL